MPNASAKVPDPGTQRLAAMRGTLAKRSAILASVRKSFDSLGYLEVTTPVGIPAPAAEEFIEAPKADGFFLRTSPELELKRLLAAGMERIYEIGPCFRAGENGTKHRSEFTMLEYYEAHSDYMTLLSHTRSILKDACVSMHGASRCPFAGTTVDFETLEIISVRDAFRKYAGRSADECAEEDALFEMTLVDKIEPALPRDRIVALTDYPIRFGAFAREKSSDPTLVERWEIYIGGMELANAYGELVDSSIQRNRFKSFAETRKKLGLTEYPHPASFLAALDSGIPESSGCALGFDRLVMLLLDLQDIALVTFPLD